MNLVEILINKYPALTKDTPLVDIPNIVTELEWEDLYIELKFGNNKPGKYYAARFGEIETKPEQFIDYQNDTYCDCGKLISECDKSYIHMTRGV